MRLMGDVSGHTTIIVDDMIDTGGTNVYAKAETLMKMAP